ncbi:unnamed protein product [Darwinula stevensoni]|uniref:IPT/TIG domain-containing protein n=1 Tax=Darwinula stevensoni TaxID=69355 RepID=A0A7R9A863_9CRUS|nr:unnamed protein product [Darwinula stevensoni]CAG0895795.1 unnamed protein product [Darwinula stevensoni]
MREDAGRNQTEGCPRIDGWDVDGKNGSSPDIYVPFLGNSLLKLHIERFPVPLHEAGLDLQCIFEFLEEMPQIKVPGRGLESKPGWILCDDIAPVLRHGGNGSTERWFSKCGIMGDKIDMIPGPSRPKLPRHDAERAYKEDKIADLLEAISFYSDSDLNSSSDSSAEGAAMVVCRIVNRPSPKPERGPIMMTGNFLGENPKSEKSYEFVNPEIHAIIPSFGPKSGGTLLQIYGKHLNAGRNVSATLGSSKCEELKRLKATVVVAVVAVTPNARAYDAMPFWVIG